MDGYEKLELQLQQKRKLLREKQKIKKVLDEEVEKLIKEIKDLEKKISK